MGLVRLDRDEVIAAAVGSLGFDASSVDLEAPEVLAALIRRAASFQCPVTPLGLVRSVEEALTGLATVVQPDTGDSPVRAMVEDLVAYGDLVEAPIDDDQTTTSRRLLFLAQPSYVVLSGNTCVVVGIRAGGLSLGDESLDGRLRHSNHARHVTLREGEALCEVMGGLGLRELSSEQWLNHPPPTTPVAVVEEYAARLGAAGPSGSIGVVRILDPRSPVTFYRGRWHSATPRDSGRFIGRRPIEFGADQWCYCDVVDGEVVRLIDLPAADRLARGCDEAWRLQAAIDAVAGTPQFVRVRHDLPRDQAIVQFQSPIPSWAQRRLDALGQPLGHQKGCLFAYRVPARLLEAELTFLSESTWLEVESEGEVG